MSRVRDPFSIEGKFPLPEQRAEVVVVGAGPAGIAAASAAARDGAKVLLVDENPVAAASMGDDTPLFYGQRMTGAVQARARMIEQIFNTSPGLEAAFELGVDIQLGVSAWGAFVNGPALQALPGPMVGLADDQRAWLCGFDRLIVAAGARDLAMAFPGWDQAGVMGARGLHALLVRYEAFAGRRLVILGSGALALETALMVLERGLEVAAIVEVGDAPRGPSELVSAVRARGVDVHTRTVIRRALGGLDGVCAAILAGPDGEREIACDTICLAIGATPMIELLDVAGARLTFDGARGGHVPVVGDGGATSAPGVFAIGDCAGLPDRDGIDQSDYQMQWMRALAAQGDEDVIVCQCEEVTRGALTGVRPPRYLGEPPPAQAARDLAGLLADGPPNQDQIKRLTRACMGVCQARRCREQVALTLARSANIPPSAVPLAGYRAPVRPLSLRVLSAGEEAAAMAAHWDVWFGIPTQWTPYADIGTDHEAPGVGL